MMPTQSHNFFIHFYYFFPSIIFAFEQLTRNEMKSKIDLISRNKNNCGD